MLSRDWTVVGREAEIRALLGLLTGARPGGAALVGPVGAGKTSVARAFLEQVNGAGFATAQATGTLAAKRLSFGALAPLLPQVSLRTPQRADDRSHLLRQNAATLVEQADGRRLVLLVDDAHLLDDMSALLIYELVSTQMASLLVTVRTGESVPDALVALWEDGWCERLELKPLERESIDAALCLALKGPVDRAAVDRLALASQGNMLVLRELVHGALEEGALCLESGIWRLLGSLSPSAGMIELVEARLGTLEEAERAALEVVSFGEPLGPGELHTLVDGTVTDRLERRGLLSSRRAGRRLEIRLAHPIYGDVLRARIPGLRGEGLAGSLAEVVEGTGMRRWDDTLRVATWRLDRGGGRPELMLAAAVAARWHYDFSLAERLARAAVQSGAGFDAALLAAQLAMLQGRGEEAEAELAALAGQAADDDQRGMVATTRMDNCIAFLGLIEEGLRIAEVAEDTIRDPAWRDEIQAKRSVVLLGTKGPRAGAEAAEPLLERTEGRALVFASIIAASSFSRLGRLSAALEAATRAHAAYTALKQPFDWYAWFHDQARCDALVLAGRIDEAEALGRAHYLQQLDARSVEGQAVFAWVLSKSALARGHVQTAVRYGREAVALSRQLGRPQTESVCLVYLALAFALSGKADEAADTLAVLDKLGLERNLYVATDTLEARAWTAVAGGDLRLARKLLKEAVALGDSIGDNMGVVAALHGLARLGQARAVAPRLAAAAAPVEGDLARTRVAHARALAAHDAAGLGRVSAAFETMGADLLAAEAAADGAVEWRRQGQQRCVAAAEQQARRLAARCEGATTPALRAFEGRALLTLAEQDAVALAASGRTNKEIAEDLHLSVRTVETYLQRAYEKLGVSGREELRDS